MTDPGVPPSPSLRAVLQETTHRLADAGCPSPAADAAALVAAAHGVDPGELHRLVLLGRPASADAGEMEELEGWVQRRVAREPLQHILGQAWFAGVSLEVGPGVFVPRPETELLVERAAQVICEELAPSAGSASQVEVVDLCAGSGAVVVGVATRVEARRAAGQHAPDLVLRAVERDQRAAEYCQRNVDRMGLTVDLRVSDARYEFADREGLVDLVVSNPPYVPQDAVPADQEVRDHDPEVALYGGSADGLAIPLALTRHARDLLRPGGWLLMEHDDSQGESMPRVLEELGFTEVRDHLDLAGRPRLVEGRWPGR